MFTLIKNMFKALGLTVFLFGSSHLLVSYFLMLTRDYQEGNLFRILNYQKLIPGLDLGMPSFIIGNVIGVGVYFGFLFYVYKKSKKSMTKPATDETE